MFLAKNSRCFFTLLIVCSLAILSIALLGIAKFGASRVGAQSASAQNCLLQGETCQSDDQCCSWVCKSEKCSCNADGEGCALSRHCCSGNCSYPDPNILSGTCVSCKENEQHCGESKECCSGFCNPETISCAPPAVVCQAGSTKCLSSSVPGANGWLEKCQNNQWVFQNYCLGACKSDGAACDESTGAILDKSCATIDSPEKVSFQPKGAACSKNSFSGACDGAGHCVISANPGCVVTFNDNLAPQSQGVVCYDEQNRNGTCDGAGNCVIGSSGGGNNSCAEYCQGLGKESICVTVNYRDLAHTEFNSNYFCAPATWDNHDSDQYTSRGYNYCALNISEPPYGEGVRCTDPAPSDDQIRAKCYCYVKDTSPCLPNCQQRCGSNGCTKPTPEICCDGIDNDFDGRSDAADSDCQKGSNEARLVAGNNSNLCWEAAVRNLGYNESAASKIFSCPSGYFTKADFDYVKMGNATIEVHDASRNDGVLAADLPTTANISPYPITNRKILFPTDKIYFSLSPHDTGIVSLKLNNIECVKADTINQFCSSCGDAGILWGILNKCDEDECAGLGDCAFQPNNYFWDACYPKAEARFTARDALTGEKLSGIKITIDKETKNCTTSSTDGACSLDLGLGATYKARASGPGYLCQGDHCPKEFKVGSNPYEVGLNLFRVVSCADSDATANFPNGKDNYYQRGTVNDTSGSATDACSTDPDRPKELKEYYCDKDTAKSKTYACALGCQEGACLKSGQGQKAKVTFNVLAVNEAGAEVPAAGIRVLVGPAGSGSGLTFASCLTSASGSCEAELEPGEYMASVRDALQQGDPFYLCEETLGCPKTFTAQGRDDIVALKLKKRFPLFDYCYDGDGGQDYEKQGATKEFKTWYPDPTVAIDYCWNDGKTLLEYFCDKKFIDSIKYTCPYGCVNGACVTPTGITFTVVDAANENNRIGSVVVQAFRAGGGLISSCTTASDGSACVIPINTGVEFYSFAVKQGYRCDNDVCYRPLQAGANQSVTLALRSADTQASGASCADCGFYCSKEECVSLGNCTFTDQPFPSPNTCVAIQPTAQDTPITFEILDKVSQEKITNALVRVNDNAGQEIGRCSANSEGRCDLTLLVNQAYRIYVSADNYQTQGPLDYTPVSRQEPIFKAQLARDTSPVCTDSDATTAQYADGKNYYVQGKAQDSTGVHPDSCTGTSPVLLEAICVNNAFQSIEYTCPYGCSEGVCRIKVSFRVLETDEVKIANSVVQVTPIAGGTSLQCTTGNNGECILELPHGMSYRAVTTPAGYNQTEREFQVATFTPRDNSVPGGRIIELKVQKNKGTCSTCGAGLTNLCDAAKCASLGDCIFAENHCLEQQDWELIQNINNKIEEIDSKIDNIQDKLSDSNLPEEQKQNIQDQLDEIQNEIQEIKERLPQDLVSSSGLQRFFFGNDVLADVGDVTTEEMGEMQDNLDSLNTQVNTINNVVTSGNTSGSFGPGDRSFSIGIVNPIASNDITSLVRNLTNYILALTASVMLIMMIISGYRYMTAGGNEERATKAKQAIQWTLVGILIILVSGIVINSLIMMLKR